MDNAETVEQIKPSSRQTAAPEPYLDKEGGYANAQIGQAAEIAAMRQQAPVSANNLPTKQYLEATITPTVLRALTEVTKARPENPLEFVAYYLLKHNPNRQTKDGGAPIGHRHPEDKAEE
jgi:protein dpy-30